MYTSLNFASSRLCLKIIWKFLVSFSMHGWIACWFEQNYIILTTTSSGPSLTMETLCSIEVTPLPGRVLQAMFWSRLYTSSMRCQRPAGQHCARRGDCMHALFIYCSVGSRDLTIWIADRSYQELEIAARRVLNEQSFWCWDSADNMTDVLSNKMIMKKKTMDGLLTSTVVGCCLRGSKSSSDSAGSGTQSWRVSLEILNESWDFSSVSRSLWQQVECNSYCNLERALLSKVFKLLG